MFRKVVQAAIRYKYAATGLLALVLLVSAVTFAWPGRKEGGAPANGTKTPATSLVPTGTPTSSAMTELAATPTPSQASDGKPFFSYAACPPDVTWYPANAAASGFTPVEAPKGMPLEGIRQISTGHLFDAAGYGMEFGTSYALADNGTIYRWGLTGWGNGPERNAFPTKVKGLPAGEKVVQLDGRFVLMQSGTLYDLNAEGGPKPIQGLPKGNVIAQSDDVSVYVLASDGSLTLYSLHGQDGKPVVSKVKADFKAASVTSGPFITLASDQSGKVWVLQAFFSTSPDSLPHLLELPDKEKVQRINATMSPQVPAYILSDRGEWFSLNMEGKLTLADVPAGTVEVTAMETITVALKADGTVRGWGIGMNEGYPGYISGEPVPASSAKPITGLEHVKSITAGSNHLLALTQDGKVLSFGSNMYGQLGQEAVNADRIHPIGTWSGLDAMFPSYGRTYAIKDGDLWVMKDGGATQAVLLGQKAFKVVEALGHYAVLTEDGRLLVPEPEEAKSCKVIQAPGPVKDVSAATNGILVALTDGRVYYVQGNFTSLDAEVELKFEPKPKGNSIQVSGDPIPFVLTDQGELYYKERTEDGKPLMKLVNTEVPLKRWSPMYYVFFDGIGYIGKALDTNGQVIDIEVSLQRDGHVENEKAAVKPHPTGRKAVALTGGAEIGADGRIVDGNNRIRLDAAVPEGEKLHAYASRYHFPIEGRSYFRHIFITEKGTIYWLGDLPVSYWRPTAKEVTVRN